MTLIQDLHAAISRRDWHAVEVAANRLRDTDLEADNAALTARVKELEADVKREAQSSTYNAQDCLDEQLRAEALEAKLAAAEKVRLAAEHVIWFDWSDNDDDAVKAVSDLRAVLGGKPS